MTMLKLPRHIHLCIKHNPYRVDYDYHSVEEWIAQWLFLEEIAKSKPNETIAAMFAPEAKIAASEIIKFAPRDIIDTNDLAEILRTGEIWVIYWNPDTPVGSCEVIAATLERALELALEIGGDRWIPEDPSITPTVKSARDGAESER